MDNVIIIPIGDNCNPSIVLRHLGLRKSAYPWDWADHTNIIDIIDVINNKNNFQIEKWKNFTDIQKYLPHDYNHDVHGEVENIFDNCSLYEKYERRFSRFFKDIESDNTYLLRFGNGDDLDILINMLPKCNILHYPDANINCNSTKDELKKMFKVDDISNIMVGISYVPRTFPKTYTNFKEEFLTSINSVKLEINFEIFDRIFNNKNIIWSDVNDFFSYIKKNISYISDTEYCYL